LICVLLVEPRHILEFCLAVVIVSYHHRGSTFLFLSSPTLHILVRLGFGGLEEIIVRSFEVSKLNALGSNGAFELVDFLLLVSDF
jgi:hypothetical protein